MINARCHRGYTVIELLVALLVAGACALMAHRTLSVAVDGGQAAKVARSNTDRSANSERWLATALLSLNIGEGVASFEGTPDRLAFAAALLTERGWRESRDIVLEHAGGAFIATAGSNPAIVLATDVRMVHFDYLLEPGADARWVQAWSSPTTAPLAVRIRVIRRTTADTALFLIRERG